MKSLENGIFMANSKARPPKHKRIVKESSAVFDSLNFIAVCQFLCLVFILGLLVNCPLYSLRPITLDWGILLAILIKTRFSQPMAVWLLRETTK